MAVGSWTAVPAPSLSASLCIRPPLDGISAGAGVGHSTPVSYSERTAFQLLMPSLLRPGSFAAFALYTARSTVRFRRLATCACRRQSNRGGVDCSVVEVSRASMAVGSWTAPSLSSWLCVCSPCDGISAGAAVGHSTPVTYSVRAEFKWGDGGIQQNGCDAKMEPWSC